MLYRRDSGIVPSRDYGKQLEGNRWRVRWGIQKRLLRLFLGVLGHTDGDPLGLIRREIAVMKKLE
jgi:hypothetical protein